MLTLTALLSEGDNGSVPYSCGTGHTDNGNGTCILNFISGTLRASNTDPSTGTTCPSTFIPIQQFWQLDLTTSTDSNHCIVQSIRWDISSIPDTSTIIDVDTRFDLSGPILNPRNCDWNSMENDPNTLSASDNWNDVLNGTTFVNNDSTCTTGSDKILDLGDSANFDLQNNLPSDWWAVGAAFDNMTRDDVRHLIGENATTDRFELQIIYAP